MVDKEAINQERRIKQGLCPIPDYEVIMKRPVHSSLLWFVMSFLFGVALALILVIFLIELKGI